MKAYILMTILSIFFAGAFSNAATPAHYSCKKAIGETSGIDSLEIIISGRDSIQVANSVGSSWKSLRDENLFSASDEDGGGVYDFRLQGNFHVYVPLTLMEVRENEGKVYLAVDNGATPHTNAYQAQLVAAYDCKLVPAN